MINRYNVIMKLNPNVKYIFEDKYYDAPNGNEVFIDEDAVDAYIASTEYQRNRASEYPSIGDQLDMIYKAGQGGDAFQAAIQAVKDKYPKG